MISRATRLALPILVACALITGGAVRLARGEEDLGTKIKRIFEPTPTPPPKKRKASTKKKPSPTPSPSCFAEKGSNSGTLAEPFTEKEKRLGEEKPHA